MRAPIFTQNTPPPLDTAARDILATVDYLVDQLFLRAGQLDAAQIAMLCDSATTLRRQLRAKAREVA
jgi:hypothetical protein